MRQRLLTTLTTAALVWMGAAAVEAGWDEGVAAFKAGNFSAAASEFQAVVDQQPDWPGGHYMLGQTMLKLGKSQDALGHLRRAYDLSPEDVGIQMALGKAYLDVRRYADAASLLGKITDSSVPQAQRATLNQMRALALEKSGQPEAALDALARAASQSPNDADLQFQYGAAALREGDTSTACSALGKAVQLDSGDAEKRTVHVQCLLRLGRTSTGNSKIAAYQQAAGSAKQLVASSSSFENLMLLGDANLGAKQYDQALTAYQQAAGKNPGDWLPHYYIGQAFTVKQQFRSAEASLKQALNKASQTKDQNTIWKQLGFVYEKQKEYDQAISAYDRAGDRAAMARVEENRKTAEYNQRVEQEAEEIRRLREEQERIKEELKELPGGPPPGP